jgi:hypothetical protein
MPIVSRRTSQGYKESNNRWTTDPSSLFAQLFCLGAAQYAPPPTSADPSTIKDCTWWFVAGASDTCDGITAAYGITQAQLLSYVSSPLLSLQYLTVGLIFYVM